MSRAKLVLVPVLVVSLCVSGPAPAGFITNGSFEANTLTAGTKEYFNTKGTSNVTGWSGGASLTFLDTPGSADNGSYLSVYGPFPKTSPDGGNFVEADGDPKYSGVIYQTVTGLTVGQVYAVSFYQAAGQQQGFKGATTEQWLVGLGATLSDSEKYAVGSAKFSLPQGGVGPWQAQTINFTASASSEVLSFLASGTPTTGAPPISFLDGVSMAPVPEPSAFVLTGIGLVGFGLVGWRRRRKLSLAV